MLKNMRNLCRVCSGPGQHEISAPIPFYLHEMDNNEALEWPQPIWMLLQDILNVPVSLLGKGTSSMVLTLSNFLFPGPT